MILKYDIIHDFKVPIPTSKDALGRVLLKQSCAGSSAGHSKQATVIQHPPQLGQACPLCPMHPDWQCAMLYVSQASAVAPLTNLTPSPPCPLYSQTQLLPVYVPSQQHLQWALVKSRFERPCHLLIEFITYRTLQLSNLASGSYEEGLGGIIFWLDAVCRAVLLEVERATCKKSQVRWAVCMQADQYQPIQQRTSTSIILQLVIQRVCIQLKLCACKFGIHRNQKNFCWLG